VPAAGEQTITRTRGREARSIVLEPGAEPIPGFRLIEPLGRGGFGEVWKADGAGGFQVVLKFVPLADTIGPVELRALKIIKDIRHPHLLAMFGAWQVAKHLVIAMELAERTLLDRFHEAVAGAPPASRPPRSSSTSWTQPGGSTI
jgi:serine/threonine-protein kinase